MKIAVISDTHSSAATIAKALDLIAAHDAHAILHCGDIEDAETVPLFPQNTHFVYGNCDSDRAGIKAAVQELGATLHEPFGHLELAGTNIAFVHGDDKRLLHDLENADAFDFLFYGHTHEAKEHRAGRTRVINPGALYRARPKSFVVVDLTVGRVESVIVE
jgi:putative phosphoesterase